jgi:hypothetical protein
MKGVKARVMNELEAGKHVEGWKLVEGRSHRKWKDQGQAEEILTSFVAPDKLYTKKFISPSQAEKLIGKKVMVNYLSLIDKPEGKPTLAPENSKKQSIKPVTVDMSLLDDI